MQPETITSAGRRQRHPLMTAEYPYIRRLTREYERRMKHIPFLNIDSLLIPSPYVREKDLDIDYDHSSVWDEEGELLGYFLVYSNPEKTRFHLYKQVTSPFGRGKGIGSAFMEKMVQEVPPESYIYLYVWEKLADSVNFFLSKGFSHEGSLVYRKMKFSMLSARAGRIREVINTQKAKKTPIAEELGKVRHDAIKTLRVLFDMTSMLSVNNFNKVIEDITRETTALLNTLNMYEDNIAVYHEVHLKELITERVIPFIESSDTPCETRLVLGSKIDPVIGNYVNVSRALINMVSNALDAIRAADRHGIIEMSMKQANDAVSLSIQDNGVGISEERLKKGPDMLPLFVGKTTKKRKAGTGIGTRQIYSTFGPANIDIESRVGEYSRWTVTLRKSSRQDTALLAELENRYTELSKATETIGINEGSSRTEVSAFIWQLRQMEIFCYDLVYHFSRYSNVRDIYRDILAYRYGGQNLAFLKAEIGKCRIDNEIIKSWLFNIVKRIRRNENFVMHRFYYDSYKGILFKSYGQAIDRTIIFTLDPVTGRFHATDRKLAEHLDFVQFLGGERDQLLRGEFSGDVKNLSSPIQLGVWSVTSHDDLLRKIKLLRKGAGQLLQMGLKREKHLSFYATTYNQHTSDVNTFKTVTLAEMAFLPDDQFARLIASSDTELQGMVFCD